LLYVQLMLAEVTNTIVCPSGMIFYLQAFSVSYHISAVSRRIFQQAFQRHITQLIIIS